jgi:hypothetical protein
MLAAFALIPSGAKKKPEVIEDPLGFVEAMKKMNLVMAPGDWYMVKHNYEAVTVVSDGKTWHIV